MPVPRTAIVVPRGIEGGFVRRRIDAAGEAGDDRESASRRERRARDASRR